MKNKLDNLEDHFERLENKFDEIIRLLESSKNNSTASQ